MGKLDVSLDEIRAKHWIEDVHSEIADVEMVLERMLAAQREMSSDDTIMNSIQKATDVCEDAWKSLCRGFKESASHMEKGIKILVEAGKIAADSFEEAKKRIQ